MEDDKVISLVHQRLSLLCKELSISESQFSTRIGKSRCYIASLKKDITSEVLHNISIEFPEVNILWLINGDGDMLLNCDNDVVTDDKLTNFIISENKRLRKRIEELLIENTHLKDEIKHTNLKNQPTDIKKCL